VQTLPDDLTGHLLRYHDGEGDLWRRLLTEALSGVDLSPLEWQPSPWCLPGYCVLLGHEGPWGMRELVAMWRVREDGSLVRLSVHGQVEGSREP
jgi:hypothetical protein